MTRFLLFALLCWSASASALEDRTYMGSTCQQSIIEPAYGSYSWAGGFTTPNQDVAIALCPIYRRNSQNYSLFYAATVNIEPPYPHDQPLSCTAYSRHPTGSSYFFSTRSTYSDPTTRQLYYGSLNANTGWWGYFYCFLPLNGARIGSYRVQEP